MSPFHRLVYSSFDRKDVRTQISAQVILYDKDLQSTEGHRRPRSTGLMPPVFPARSSWNYGVRGWLTRSNCNSSPGSPGQPANTIQVTITSDINVSGRYILRWPLGLPILPLLLSPCLSSRFVLSFRNPAKLIFDV